MRPGERPNRPRVKIQRAQLDRYQSRPLQQAPTPAPTQQAPPQKPQSSATVPQPQTIELKTQFVKPEPITQQPITNTKKLKKVKKPRKHLIKSSRIRRFIKVVLISTVFAACLVIVIGGSYLYIYNQLAASADLRAARSFTETIQAKNTDKAYSMTNNGFKDSATKEQLNQVIEKIHPFYPGKLELSTHWHDKPKVKDSTQSVIVYKSIVNDNDYYLRIILERPKPTAKWEILNLQSSNTELKANPDSIQDTQPTEEQPAN